MEMLVVMAILSILALVTVPYVEITVKRNKELELHRALREIRTTIDQVHEDWKQGQVSKFDNSVSEDGYPRTLEVMVNGVGQTGPRGVKKKYLRRIPSDPFGDGSLAPEKQWGLRSYQDKADSTQWGGQDVWDVYSANDGKALDGTIYHDW